MVFSIQFRLILPYGCLSQPRSVQVVEGHYCGRRVAVKQIDTGLLLQHQQQHQPPSCAAAALDRESGEGDVPPPPSSAHQQQDVQQQQQQPPAGPESPSPAAAPPPATQAAAAATVAAGGAATAAAAGVPAAAAAGSQQLPLAYTQALTVYVSSAGAFPVTASDASNSSNSASPQQKQGQQQPQVPPAVAIGHAQSSSSQNRKFQDSLIAILEQEVQVLARYVRTHTHPPPTHTHGMHSWTSQGIAKWLFLGWVVRVCVRGTHMFACPH